LPHAPAIFTRTKRGCAFADAIVSRQRRNRQRDYTRMPRAAPRAAAQRAYAQAARRVRVCQMRSMQQEARDEPSTLIQATVAARKCAKRFSSATP